MFKKYCENEYRTDIQGLRAISSIIIMVFHIWLNKVSGGVDVFFVISGFLMSYILLKDFFQNGTVNPLPFWGGIIKRVAPSAYIVLFVTLFISYFISSPTQLKSIIIEVIASSLHIENLELMRKSVDYLESGNVPSPVQQFWALSIQIQFYFILPFIIMPLAFLSNKKRTSAPLFLGIILITLASFIYATISVQNNATTSYFNPLSRAWEFFLGVLSFLIISNINTIKYRTALGIIGLLLIIGGAIMIPSGAGFPGPVSLIPVSGAICIIASGAYGKGIVNKFLSSKYLVLLGGMSFSVYLWHWPILVFYKEYFNQEAIGLLQGLIIICLAIFLAYFTSTVIESPFRKIPRKKALLNFSIGLVFSILVLIPASIIMYNISSTIDSYNKEWEAKVFERNSSDKIYLESNIVEFDRNEFIAAKDILPKPYTNGCHQNQRATEAKKCSFGDLQSDIEVILVGGSHSLQWLPALAEIAKDNEFKITSMTKSSCPFGRDDPSDKSCYEWNKNAIAEIIKTKPYAVITNSTRTERGKIEFIPESYIDSWKKIDSHGIKVIGIRDNPRFNFDVPQCVYKNRFLNNPNACSMDRKNALLEVNPAIRYKDVIHNIDMTDLLCTEDRCLTQFSGYLMYRDKHHIHLPYVKYIKNNLEEKLKKLMPDLK